ncbi:MAG: prolyl oligopeptidase family serine peptidase [Phaeodactylibacter sp.]|uniref:prolyl oligopeptidase family serine peptidase n=1 Tax=Phaeodactylibacter sp. TaxID=1940289 RepID=UPI0032EF895E
MITFVEKHTMRLFFHLLLLSLFPCVVWAQPSDLEIADIMQGERYVGFLPEEIRWHPNSQEVFFTWNPEQDTLRSLYSAGTDAAPPAAVSLERQRQLPEPGTYNPDRSLMAYAKDSDLFLYDVATGSSRQLTYTAQRESAPSFTADGRQLLFTADRNLFAWHLQEQQLQQLTFFEKGMEKSSSTPDQQEKWLETQQMELFEVLRWRDAQSRLQKERREALEADRPKTVYMGNKSWYGLQLSPDSRYVTVQMQVDEDAQRTQVPHFVDPTGYLDMERARPKVGHAQDTYEMGIYDRQRDTFYTVSTLSLEGIYDKPAYRLDVYGDTVAQYEAPRAAIIRGPVFSDDGRAVVVVRALDNKTRWIAELDLGKGQLIQADRQQDDAWIGGPGISGWNFSTGTLGWLDEHTIYYQSEATGYSHLYTHDLDTDERTALTSGAFEIRSAQLSRDKQTYFIIANAESPFEQHFYHLPVEGGTLQKVTDAPGKYEVEVSPDEQTLALRYSYSNQPWELYLMDNQPGRKMRQVTGSTTEAFESYEWREPEIIRFTASDGAKVPARLYKPKKGAKGGKAVIFVHGAGYLQNVHRWWSSYYREYMFHNLLVDHGFTVLDIDYRGSDGYGRDWRTGIYRHMGGKDLSDQVDGAAYLVEELGIDPQRIGIYGGSYGGFITLMALFTSPGTFECGAALRSVTDWAHYNHSYTSNILNTPVEDSIAFRQSSPIYFAEGLQDRLLILHGMVDDNVQFQDVVRLSQRLIELGKEDWELSVFPLEPHGFIEPSSWTDEYRRIFKLFKDL